MPANEARVLVIEANDALRVMLFTVLRHQPSARSPFPHFPEPPGDSEREEGGAE